MWTGATSSGCCRRRIVIFWCLLKLCARRRRRTFDVRLRTIPCVSCFPPCANVVPALSRTTLGACLAVFIPPQHPSSNVSGDACVGVVHARHGQSWHMPDMDVCNTHVTMSRMHSHSTCQAWQSWDRAQHASVIAGQGSVRHQCRLDQLMKIAAVWIGLFVILPIFHNIPECLEVGCLLLMWE